MLVSFPGAVQASLMEVLVIWLEDRSRIAAGGVSVLGVISGKVVKDWSKEADSLPELSADLTLK